MLGPQFFHWSDKRFKEGSTVSPPNITGVKSKHKKADSNSVYVYNTTDDVGHMGMSHHGKYLYEVDPQGELSPDPDPTIKSVSAFSSPSAKVIRKII